MLGNEDIAITKERMTPILCADLKKHSAPLVLFL